MKRSKALVSIFETLESHFSHPEGNAKIAESILKTVEGLGMLPPLTAEDRMYHADLDVKWEKE
jgi:hypothetical protein